ncbi:putative tRNA synthetase [Bradyrhizobium sp. ORS 375]|uniref:class I tRNA ligase family protein n=1 Tax=Bradyrhizobium sp. (strain ORS 375) TaxID=566679 RepID=UPI0002406AAA|nr:class I tRNA ligase family protein [Bradyrhizobium sp. ORS 375]CCD96736.1 putative tRNA synthetase [Bradyrhizobium sp. ORS 375]
MRSNDWIVTVPPPTPNGGLHVGHLSGPYLAADAFSRNLKLRGVRCAYTTFSDVNQSYVRVTAERQRIKPYDLARQYSDDIRHTMALYQIDVADFSMPNAVECEQVRQFFLELYRRGILVRKEFPTFFSLDRGTPLDEAGVSGHCPKCLDECKCGICESCGFLCDARSIIAPRDTVTGSRRLEVRMVPLLVLEMERFREGIRDFYRSTGRYRPRYGWLVADALSAPLPDFPITVEGSWGIPMAHSDFPGQVINAWPELVVHQLLDHKRRVRDGSHLPNVVNFLGFDNTYFYAIVHAALLIAGGESDWLPFGSITNEFYSLDHSKFSTSRNHVVWARDLASRHSTDLIRFHTFLNSPGFERANFSESEMVAQIDAALSQPWQEVYHAYDRLSRGRMRESEASSGARNAASAAVTRILGSLSLDRFHLRQAAEDLRHFLRFIRAELCTPSSNVHDLAFALKAFSQAAFPLMPIDARRLFWALTGADVNRLDLVPESSPRPIPDGLFQIRESERSDTPQSETRYVLGG